MHVLWNCLQTSVFNQWGCYIKIFNTMPCTNWKPVSHFNYPVSLFNYILQVLCTNHKKRHFDILPLNFRDTSKKTVLPRTGTYKTLNKEIIYFSYSCLAKWVHDFQNSNAVSLVIQTLSHQTTALRLCNAILTLWRAVVVVCMDCTTSSVPDSPSFIYNETKRFNTFFTNLNRWQKHNA